MVGKLLLTGAGGYLGRRIAQQWLATTDQEIVLWLRGKDAADVAAKRASFGDLFASHGSRVQLAFGDLFEDDPFRAVDPAGIGTIIHGAAIIRFNVDREDARRGNLEGTEKLLCFAEKCPRLENLGLVSTVYASGLRAGPVEERLFAGEDGFCNNYEWSKWEGENALATRHGSLPWRILRVATVMADDDGGAVSQYNAVHNTLMLFHYGLLSLIPGAKDVPLYFVTGAFTAAAIAAAMAAPVPRPEDRGSRVFHICHRREESVTLGAFVDAAFERFGEDEAFKARRLLKPLFADQEAFDILVEGMRGFGGGVVNDSLASVTPFARQLFVAKDIRNDNLRSAMPAYRAPDPLALIRNVCGHLIRTKWGRLP